MQALFTIFLLFVSQALLSQNSGKYDFSIIFASCFDNDTVELKLNGSPILPATGITSHAVSGVTGLSVFQNKEGLWVLNKNEKQQQDLAFIKDSLRLEVRVNDQWNLFIIKLTNGKIIFVNHCYVEEADLRKRKLTITQHKERVSLY